MHNNYFFLKQLSLTLGSRIREFVIDSCFSQNKDELVFHLVRDQEEFWIKADLKNQFSCLSFPGEFSRARKNSIDLFPETIGCQVLEVCPYDYERAFALRLENCLTLVFKLFGNFSNILLFRNKECVSVFKHGTGDEAKISLETLHRQCTLPGNDELLTLDSLKKRIPAFDKHILEYLVRHGFRDNLDTTCQHKLLSDTLAYLQNPIFHVTGEGSSVKLSLLPDIPQGEQFTDPLEAINHLYNEYQKGYWLENQKNTLARELQQRLKKTRNYLKKSEEKLQELLKAGSYQQTGDIIMANLSKLKTGQEKAELYDFYSDRVVSIKLKKNLSPQRNAEQYYRKAKNQRIEISTLKKNIEQKKNDAHIIQEHVQSLSCISDIKDLRSFARHSGLIKKDKERAAEPPRFKVYDHLGFRILVGRNAKNNDELTFQFGYKDDLWLHAKDVKGSHVLVKYQPGRNFPKPVIEMAAQLAAYYSGYKNSDTCPVICTPRKYVRKSKGMPPGAVLVDREEIIFVKPQDHGSN